MADVTSVPPIQFTPTGLVIPEESAILAGVQADYNAAFGGKLNPALNTPQGQLATSTTAIVAENNTAFAEFVDQVDPDNATGFMQDAIARIYFLNRQPGTPTAVQLVCVGGFNTVIPLGALAQDTSGNLYSCTQPGSIPISGTITLSFACTKLGPTPCPANTVNKIYQAIPGWDTVNNPTQGVVGSNVESPAEFEFRRQNSVALNAHGSLPSIYAAVFDVTNVIDVYATENVTSAPVIVGSTNYTLAPHSLYVAAVGGITQDIANAIWTKKDVGCDYNGNTSATVVDESGYSYPFPSYTVTFERPDATPFNFIVNIVNSAALPSSIAADVTAAITAQFTGTNGAQRVRIGALLLAASFYGPVATCEGPSVPVQVLSIFLGSTFTGTATLVAGSETITIVSVAGAGVVSPGTVVAGTDIPTGTTIVKQLTGSVGSTGTYQMSNQASGTVSSAEAVTGVGGTAQQIGIDQAPVLGTVVVNLV